MRKKGPLSRLGPRRMIHPLTVKHATPRQMAVLLRRSRQSLQQHLSLLRWMDLTIVNRKRRVSIRL